MSTVRIPSTWNSGNASFVRDHPLGVQGGWDDAVLRWLGRDDSPAPEDSTIFVADVEVLTGPMGPTQQAWLATALLQGRVRLDPIPQQYRDRLLPPVLAPLVPATPPPWHNPSQSRCLPHQLPSSFSQSYLPLSIFLTALLSRSPIGLDCRQLRKEEAASPSAESTDPYPTRLHEATSASSAQEEQAVAASEAEDRSAAYRLRYLKTLVEAVPAAAAPASAVLPVTATWACTARNGRYSSTSPNLQATPRTLRTIFVPLTPRSRAPESQPTQPSTTRLFFIEADYHIAELLSLASLSLSRYRTSFLGRVIQEGRDPHAHTADLIWGKDGGGSEYGASERRSIAKAFNFGVAGGAGPASLAAWSGERVPIARADEVRTQLMTDIYPEIGVYVDDDPLRGLAVSMQTSVSQVWRVMGGGSARRGWRGRRSLARSVDRAVALVNSVASGSAFSAAGRPISYSDQATVWTWLARLNRNPALQPHIDACTGSPDFAALLLGQTVETPTGFTRQHASYTQARNTPFASLAAQAAAVSAVALTATGFTLVNFIHDAFLIVGQAPVPLGSNDGGSDDEAVAAWLARSPAVRRQVALARQVMSDTFGAVLGGAVPVHVSARVSARWGGAAVDM